MTYYQITQQDTATHNVMSRNDLMTIMMNDQIILRHFDSKNPVLDLVRHEELDGRQYIVVPMVMLTEGVHNGSNGPIYYSEEEISRSPEQWGSRPIIIDHPYNNKSGSDLETYKKQRVGFVMNPLYENGKLKAEAWLDIEHVKNKCPQILVHIEHGLPMEISTGLLNEILDERGTWHGEPFIGKIAYIRADHLAILPKEQGACSLSDGAGLLCNSEKSTRPSTYNAFYISGDVLKGTEYPYEPLNDATRPTVTIPPTQPLKFRPPNVAHQEQFLQKMPGDTAVDPTLIASITAAVAAALQTIQPAQPKTEQAQPIVVDVNGQPFAYTDSTGASVTQIAPEAPNQIPPNENPPGAASEQAPLELDQAESYKNGIDQLRNPVITEQDLQQESNEPNQHNLKRNMTTQNDVNVPNPPVAPVQEPQMDPAQPPVAQDPITENPLTPEQPVNPMQQVIELLQQAIIALQDTMPDAAQDASAAITSQPEQDNIPSAAPIDDTQAAPAEQAMLARNASSLPLVAGRTENNTKNMKIPQERKVALMQNMHKVYDAFNELCETILFVNRNFPDPRLGQLDKIVKDARNAFTPAYRLANNTIVIENNTKNSLKIKHRKK